MYTDCVRENVEELRHRETLSFLIMIMGMISLMGGFTMTAIAADQVRWFFLLPFEPALGPSSLLSLTLILLGFALTSAGFILAVYYDREKMWFLKHLKESNPVVDTILKKGKKKY
ncbi:MAG: hypothetical protein ACE5L6_01340 [Candidatus Bathyarchaeia archaeon]